MSPKHPESVLRRIRVRYALRARQEELVGSSKDDLFVGPAYQAFDPDGRSDGSFELILHSLHDEDLGRLEAKQIGIDHHARETISILVKDAWVV